MREAFVLASCDRKRCSDNWQAEVDAPPVVVTLPDGSKFELDLCNRHIQQLRADWLNSGRHTPANHVVQSSNGGTATTSKKTVTRKTATKASRRRHRRNNKVELSQRVKTPCPQEGCTSYATSASSMQTHLRVKHDIKSIEASDIVSKIYGTKPAPRVICVDCGELHPVQSLKRHRRKEHGVTE